MPKVSVIIPTYNRPGMLCEAIESVLSQTYKDYEIVVVDDGSTDNTKEVVKKYGDKLRYFYQNNQGPSAARNQGVDRSSGAYLAFLDDDDLWLPNFLETHVRTLDEEGDLAFVCSGAYVVNETGKQIDIWKMRASNSFLDLYHMNFVLTLTVLLRRQCFDAVSGFDRRFKICQDYDLWLRLAMKYKFRYQDMLLAKYRLHKGNISKNLVMRGKDHAMILRRKEFIENVGFLKSRLRVARALFNFSQICSSEGRFCDAWILLGKAIMFYPFIGRYYWPEETKNVRFSLIYRILKVYFLIILYFLKIFKKVKFYV
jgi:glycosyltransferase involved in cell wall biosynthesis